MKHLLSIVMAVMLAAITSASYGEVNGEPITLTTTTNTLDDETAEIRGQLVALEFSKFYTETNTVVASTAAVVLAVTPRFGPEKVIYTNASFTENSDTNVTVSGGYYSAGEVFTLRVSNKQTNMVLKALLKYIK